MREAVSTHTQLHKPQFYQDSTSPMKVMGVHAGMKSNSGQDGWEVRYPAVL